VVDARRERWLFGLATTALVLPLVVLAVRVVAHDWSNPGGDIALIELRTRDVGGHTPLLGSYGRYGFNQPGALWFYALALPYRLLGSRYAGMQLGVIAVNTAAIVTIVAIARRRGGVVAMLVVTALLGVLLHGLGGAWLADPWEPHALTLLCAALVFLAWDAAMGGRVSLVAAAAVAVLLAEAQAALVLFAFAMLAVAVVGTLRRGAPPFALAIAGGVVAVLAIPPLLALLQHETGNVADLVSSMRHPPAATLGVADGWRSVAVELSHRAPWLGWDQPLEPFATTVDVHHVFAIPIGLVAFVAVGALVVRAHNRAAGLFVAVTAGVVAAAASLARLLGPLFFWIPEWTRVLGFGAGVAVVWGAYELLQARQLPRWVEPTVISVLAAVTFIGAAVCTVDAWRAEPTANPSVDAVHRLARAALPQVRAGTSLVTATSDPSQLLGSDPGSPTLVLDLERAGADVVVDTSLADHYGAHRADRARAGRELRLLTDRDPVPEGFRVIATEDPLSPAQRAARDDLLARYPELGPTFSAPDRLRLIQTRPELRAAAQQLDRIPALPILSLAVRNLP
jgi:hypothetical protein